MGYEPDELAKGPGILGMWARHMSGGQRQLVYDAVVVGGGPAGAIVARGLARAGARVALMEKEQYPRRKVCAGGLTPRARALLEEVVGDQWRSAATAEVRGVTVWTQGQSPLRYELEPQPWYTVSREAFDHLLAESAAAAGAEVLTGFRVDRVTGESGRWLVHSRRGVLTASSVVAADGTCGVVARSLGVLPCSRMAPAVEAEVSLASSNGEVGRDIWLGSAPRRGKPTRRLSMKPSGPTFTGAGFLLG